MQRLKKWLEGSAIALMSWMLVGTLVFGVPMPAKAGSASAEFDIWVIKAPSVREAGYIGWTAYNNRECSGDRMAYGYSALELYRDIGGRMYDGVMAGWVCREGKSSYYLHNKAREDWEACKQWAGEQYDRINNDKLDWSSQPGSAAPVGAIAPWLIKVIYATFGSIAGWIAARTMDKAADRAEDIAKICGSSVNG